MLLLVLLFRELRVHILMKSWLKNERKGALTNCLASTKKRDWAWDKIQDEWWKSGRSCVHYIELKARVGWERNRAVIKKKAGGADWSKREKKQTGLSWQKVWCMCLSECVQRKKGLYLCGWLSETECKVTKNKDRELRRRAHIADRRRKEEETKRERGREY